MANALRKLQFDTTTSKIVMESSEQKNVVAVLDFTNITADPAIDWLSSGIAETVTIDLKKVGQLKVLNREKIYKALGSSQTKNFTQENVVRLGKELGLNWIIGAVFNGWEMRSGLQPNLQTSRMTNLFWQQVIFL